MIGTVQASITSWSDNTIVCVVPTSVSPGSRNVTVTTSAGTSSAYVITVTAMTGAPSISTITPTTVNQGSNISISGLNFGTKDSKDTSYVMIGSVAGTIVTWTNTLIVVTITTSTTQGSNNVYVSVGGVSSNTSTITIVSSTAPTISSLSPSSVTQGAGTALTIYGTNFGTAGATSYVTIGGYAATVTSWGTNTIIVTVPNSVAAGSANVYVIVAGTSTNAYALTVSSATTPSISGISGTTAGGTCTISGSGFGSTTGTVTIGGVAATVTGWAASTVTCTFPYTCAPTGTLTLTASTGAASTTYTRTYAWGAAAVRSGGTGGVASPKVLFDKRSTNLGDAMLLFIENDGTPNKGLWARRFNSATGWAAAISRVDLDPGADVSEFDCAMDSNGRVVAVYVQSNRVYWAYYTALTGNWTTAAAGQQINAADGANVACPKIAIGTDNNGICAFVDQDQKIYARQWVGATPEWNAAVQKLYDTASANNGLINIAMDSSNRAICTYRYGAVPDLGAWRYTSGVWPATWADQGQISGGAAVTVPQLAVSTAGNAVATFVEGGRVYANRYAAGGAWAGPETVDAGAGGAPQVACDSNANAIVIYTNGGHVYSRQLIAAGGSSALLQLDDNSANACTLPFISFDPSRAYGMLGYVQDDRIVTRRYTAATAWASAWAAQAFADGDTGSALTGLFIAGGTGGVFIPAWVDAVADDVYTNIYR